MAFCEVNLVLATNQSAVQGVAVGVRSALERCTGTCNVYILSSNLPQQSKDKLEKSWKSLPNVGLIKLIDVDTNLLKDLPVNIVLRYAEAYLRLRVGDVLPAEVSRCIYMDTDLLVTDDLCKVNQVELGENIIGACMDISAPHVAKQEDRRQRLNLKQPERYLNSGFLLIDLDKWRKENIGEKTVKFARESQDILWSMDQDVLNVVLEGRWLELEQRWNLSQYAREASLDHKGIIHLIGNSKPWHADYHYKFKQFFLDILERTEFRGTRPFWLFRLFPPVETALRKFPPLSVITRKIKRELKRISG
jgi:lipopolysaccharide biosynthesis glycosyltransferase